MPITFFSPNFFYLSTNPRNLYSIFSDFNAVPDGYAPELYEELPHEFLIYMRDEYPKINPGFSFKDFFYSIPISKLLKKMDTMRDFPDEMSSHFELYSQDILDNPTFPWNWKLVSFTIPVSDIYDYIGNTNIQWDFTFVEINPTMTRYWYDLLKKELDRDIRRHFYFLDLVSKKSLPLLTRI